MMAAFVKEFHPTEHMLPPAAQAQPNNGQLGPTHGMAAAGERRMVRYTPPAKAEPACLGCVIT